MATTLLAIASWSACSIGMTVLNHAGVQQTDAPHAVLVAQFLVAFVAAACASRDRLWSQFGKGTTRWALTVTPAFTLSILSSIVAFRYVSVSTFVVARNVAPLLTLIVEGRSEVCHAARVVGCVVMAIGAWLYISRLDASSSVVGGRADTLYGLALVWVHTLLTVGERLMMRRLLAVEPVAVPKTGLMILNNGGGATALLVYLALCDRAQGWRLWTALAAPNGLFAILVVSASCVVSCGISYTNVWLQGLVSATGFFVVGVACKFLTILWGIAVEGTTQDAWAIAGALLTVVGVGVYGCGEHVHIRRLRNWLTARWAQRPSVVVEMHRALGGGTRVAPSERDPEDDDASSGLPSSSSCCCSGGGVTAPALALLLLGAAVGVGSMRWRMDDYRIGDYVRRIPSFDEYARYNMYGLLYVDRIVGAYYRATSKPMDIDVLADIVRRRDGGPTTAQAVVHLRLGDVIDDHPRSVDDFLRGNYTLPADYASDGAHGGEAHGFEAYVYPSRYYDKVADYLWRETAIRRVLLVSGTHRATAHPEKSQQYLRAIATLFEQGGRGPARGGGFVVTVQWNHPADDDFCTMANAGVLVRSGGGFSRLAAAVGRRFNHTVLSYQLVEDRLVVDGRAPSSDDRSRRMKLPTALR